LVRDLFHSTCFCAVLLLFFRQIEDDDVCPNAKESYVQRDEPLPWGTLRLKDYGDVFNGAVMKANLVGISFFCLSLGAYLIFIFGEIHFYSKLDIGIRKYSHEVLCSARGRALLRSLLCVRTRG